MPITFDEILARFDDDHAYEGDDVIEALKAAREAVAGDPHEWWVKDEDGNRVRIGDKVLDRCSLMVQTVYGFEQSTYYERNMRVRFMSNRAADACDVCKLVPETRDELVDETIEKLWLMANLPESKKRKVVEDAIDLAMKLGAEQ